MKIKLLTECGNFLPQLAELWYEELGKHWVPNASIDHTQLRFVTHLNRDKLPLMFVAIANKKPIGMACLRMGDGIRPDLFPWLGGLVVNHNYQKQGIGKQLIATVQNSAKEFGYSKLHLFTFDSQLTAWYSKLGWEIVAQDEFLKKPVTVMAVNLIHDSN